MGSKNWGCFVDVPSGLAVPEKSLTLNWLKPEPTLSAFNLTPNDVNAVKYKRDRSTRASVSFLGSAIAISATALIVSELGFATSFVSRSSLDVILFAFVLPVIFLASITFVLSSYSVWRFELAASKRSDYERAVAVYESVKQWRRERCDAEYWMKENIQHDVFEMEAAELLAGMFRTTQVTLTRGTNDYGADALACSNEHGRIVAQCKHWKGDVGVAHVRELAGSVGYFGANLGILFCLQRPTEDRGQWDDFGSRFKLQYWNLECIVAMAKLLAIEQAE